MKTLVLPAEDRHGKIVVVTSSLGGVGTATLTKLISMSIPHTEGSNAPMVCVVDADMMHGFADQYIGDKHHSLDQLVEIQPSDVREHLRDLLLWSDDLQAWTLAAGSAETIGRVDASVYDHLLDVLQAAFDLVIVKTDAHYRNPMHHRHLYPRADEILYVMVMHRRSIVGMMVWLDAVARRMIDMNKITIVANKVRRMNPDDTDPDDQHEDRLPDDDDDQTANDDLADIAIESHQDVFMTRKELSDSVNFIVARAHTKAKRHTVNTTSEPRIIGGVPDMGSLLADAEDRHHLKDTLTLVDLQTAIHRIVKALVLDQLAN